MKKRFLLITAFFISTLSFAFEWGGVLSDDTKLTTNLDSVNFHQSNSLSLWSNLTFGSSGMTYLSAQGTFKYYWDLSKDSNQFTFPLINLDLLKFTSNGKYNASGSSFSLGRFLVSDFTSKIFSQTSDGLSFELSFPVINIGVYAGYTGLLNLSEISMLDTSGQIVSEAYSCIPASLTLSFPAAFLNQQISFQFMGFLEVPSFTSSRYYGTFLMKGPIAGPLSYQFYTSFGSLDFKNCTNLSELYFSFSPNYMLSLSLGGTYASGKIAFLEPFNGFTSNTAYNSILYPELSGVILPYISMLLIQSKFCSVMKVSGVFSMPEQDISFKGVDASLVMIFNIYSDLQLNFKASGFWDISDTGDETNLCFNLSASLAF